MMTVNIIKIGGKVIDNPILLTQFLDGFSSIEGNKILIHGGGKSADQLLLKMGIEPNMVNGRRITDLETLDVVGMTYTYLNKKIVALLQARNISAFGLSGADGGIILSHKREVKDIDYGFVGDIDTVDQQSIYDILEHNTVPVFCALTQDGNGQLLNTNADTIASEIAISLSGICAVNLIYCFDVEGVMDMENNVLIKEVTPVSFQSYKESGIFTGGILPKIENALAAVSQGVKKVVITHFSSLSHWNKSTFKGTVIHE